VLVQGTRACPGHSCLSRTLVVVQDTRACLSVAFLVVGYDALGLLDGVHAFVFFSFLVVDVMGRVESVLGLHFHRGRASVVCTMLAQALHFFPSFVWFGCHGSG